MKHKGNKNITYTQRLQLETLLNAKVKVIDIAKQLNLNRVTVYKEIKCGLYPHLVMHTDFWYGTTYKTEMRYSAQIAQRNHELASTAKGRPLKLGDDFKLVHYIEKRVQQEKISPFAILGQIKRQHLQFKTDISRTTLYRYIELGIFQNIRIEKRKPKYRKTVAKRAPKGTSIEQRPKEILSRAEFGHWEMDCVCGPTRATFLVLTERQTRFEKIFHMPNQKAESVVKCLNSLEHKFGKCFKQVFKTITVDNGSEFSNFDGMQQSIFNKTSKRTKIYYCHPYSAYERGTNERMNREIRRLVPKGTNLAKYSDADVQSIANWLNNYPRKILDFATANELFSEQLEKLFAKNRQQS